MEAAYLYYAEHHSRDKAVRPDASASHSLLHALTRCVAEMCTSEAPAGLVSVKPQPAELQAFIVRLRGPCGSRKAARQDPADGLHTRRHPRVPFATRRASSQPWHVISVHEGTLEAASAGVSHATI